MTKIKVPLEADYESIALEAGAASGTARYWNDGTVEIPNVTQESLDSALINYDHQAVLIKRESDILEIQNKLTVEQEIKEIKERLSNLVSEQAR